jgi:hypothetical protein
VSGLFLFWYIWGVKKTINTVFLLCFFSGHVFGQINLAQGLIACYPFSGNANDSSGNNNNGVVTGATLTAGEAGIPNTAYHFNGTSDYIYVANSSTLSSPTTISMCAVIKAESFYTGTCQANMIFQKGYGSIAGEYGLLFGDWPYNTDCQSMDSLHEEFDSNIGTGTLPPVYNEYINTNQWYCIIGTFDGDSIKLYVNAVQKYSVPSSNAIGTNSYPIYIGYMNPGFPYWFHGIIDDIRIYDRVLNNEEIDYYCSYLTRAEAIENSVTRIKFYPNPSSGNFKIHSQLNSHLEIFNPLGEKIYSAILNASEKEIDLKNATAGIYFVKVSDGDKTYTQKLVIQ